MWKRLRWLYTQWKLLYFPLSPLIRWLLQGIFEEWLFDYLAEYTKLHMGWAMGLITWASVHPTISTSIIVIIIAIIIAIWAIRDAKKKERELPGIVDMLEKRYDMLLDFAEERTKEIKVDKRFQNTMANIAQDILGINVRKYAGKDFKSKKIQQMIDADVRKGVKTDEESAVYYDLIASALDKDGFGLSGIEAKNKHKKLMKRLRKARKVPSFRINEVINKCLEHSYSLASAYMFHKICIINKLPIGEDVLSEYESFNRKQRIGSGGMSNCQTELEIAITNFLEGNKDGD